MRKKKLSTAQVKIVKTQKEVISFIKPRTIKYFHIKVDFDVLKERVGGR